jgi:hypothetical protein
MMRGSIAILIVVLAPFAANAQKWNITPSIFYGTFKMSSMKDFQKSMTSWGSFPAKVVNNFPGQIGYSIQAGYLISGRVEVGLRYQFTSTGGRVSYGDYSGEMRYDNLLRSNSYGIFTNIGISKSPKWPVFFSFALGRVHTDLEMKSYFRLYDDSSSLTYYTGSSTNTFFNPAFNFNRKLNDHFRVFLGVGYEFQIHGDLLGDEITAEWDGVRISLGVNYLFSFKKKLKEP